MGAIHSNFDVSGYLRGMQRHMLEAQQPDGLIPGTAPEFPIFGGGYRDDVNWGGAFIITPYLLWQTYGDTRTMREYCAPMQAYLAYVRQQIGANGLLVSGLEGLDRRGHDDAERGHGHVRAVRDRRPDGADGDRARQERRRGRLPRTGDSLGAAFNAAFFNPATKTYTTAARRSQAWPRYRWRWGSSPRTPSSRCSTTSSRASTPTTPTAAARTSAAARSRCSRSTRC